MLSLQDRQPYGGNDVTGIVAYRRGHSYNSFHRLAPLSHIAVSGYFGQPGLVNLWIGNCPGCHGEEGKLVEQIVSPVRRKPCHQDHSEHSMMGRAPPSDLRGYPNHTVAFSFVHINELIIYEGSKEHCRRCLLLEFGHVFGGRFA